MNFKDEFPSAIARWSPRVPFILPILVALAYRDLAKTDLYQRTVSEVEGAGFFEPTTTSPLLVVTLSIWVIFNRKTQIKRVMGRGSAPLSAGLLLAFSALIYLWSYYVGAVSLLLISLITLILGAGALLGGAPLMGLLALPAGLLLLAFPWPAVLMNQVVFGLQNAAAWLTLAILELFSYEAVRSGDLILANKQVFQVIETCNGLRSMETLVMSALLYMEIAERRPLHRLIIVCCAPFVAYFLNGLRIISIVLYPGDTSHTAQGIVALIVGIFTIVFLSFLLEKIYKPRPRIQAALPEARKNEFGWVGTALLCGALAISSFLVVPYELVKPKPLELSRVPLALGGWVGSAKRVDRTYLGSVGFSDEIAVKYEKGKRAINLFFGSDDLTNPMRSLRSPKAALQKTGIDVISRERIYDSPVADEVQIMLVRSATDNQYQLIYSWYDGVESLGREVMRAVLFLEASPFRRERGSYVVQLSTLIGRGEPSRAVYHETIATMEPLALQFHDAMEKIIQPVPETDLGN